MAYQNEWNNAHPPTNLCADPPWIGFPSANWGASVPPAFSVKLDPQINVRRDSLVNEHGSSLPSMEKLTEEFAAWNDDLLGELAG